jgi:hypothetical protein
LQHYNLFKVHPQEEKANLELQAAGLNGRMKNPQNSKSSAMKLSEFKIRPTREEGARKSALATQLTRGMPALDVQLLSLEMCFALLQSQARYPGGSFNAPGASHICIALRR